MCKMPMVQSVFSGDKRWSFKQGKEQRRKDQTAFLHNAEDNPLDSTVSITSMLYCQGRTDNSWSPWAIGDHGVPVSLPKLKKAY
ncbi:unnamed protein product, partial [Staurois parvus]